MSFTQPLLPILSGQSSITPHTWQQGKDQQTESLYFLCVCGGHVFNTIFITRERQEKQILQKNQNSLPYNDSPIPIFQQLHKSIKKGLLNEPRNKAGNIPDGCGFILKLDLISCVRVRSLEES